jgi:hypothetical protein
MAGKVKSNGRRRKVKIVDLLTKRPRVTCKPKVRKFKGGESMRYK